MKKILLIITIIFLHFYNITIAQIPTIEWQNTIGGSSADYLHAIQQTTDGGYILGGTSSSGISGVKSEINRGRSDYWVIKLDESGDIVWQNTIGGS